MLTIFKKNYQFTIFLILYIFIGAYLSISNGITSDEYHEQLNWEVNFSAIISFLKNGSYNELLNYKEENYQHMYFKQWKKEILKEISKK